MEKRTWCVPSFDEKSVDIAFIEVCCAENSSLRKVCEDRGVPYVGVSDNMEQERVLKMFLEKDDAVSWTWFLGACTCEHTM